MEFAMNTKDKTSMPNPAFDFVQRRDDGATLRRVGERFRWKVREWFKVLQIALAYGWCPEGTESPRGISKKMWDGDYLTAQKQRVTASDAEQLAKALKRAVKDLSTVSKTSTAENLKVLEFVDRNYKDGLSDFADFCRRGSFRITDDLADI